jgi:hypothetical protein
VRRNLASGALLVLSVGSGPNAACQSSELLLIANQSVPSTPESRPTPGAPPRDDGGAQGPVDSGSPTERDAESDASRREAGPSSTDAGDAGRMLDSPVTALNLPDTVETDPSFTADLMELYFMSTRDGSKDLFLSRRVSPDEAWGSPERLDVLSEGGQEENPFVSPDGLDLWFFTDRDRSLGSIWHTTRAQRSDPWGPPAHASGLALAEGGSDVAVSVDATRARFVLNSKFPGASPYGIHEFSVDSTSGEPAFLRTLTEVNGDTDEFDPDLREGGLFLAFDSGRAGRRQLFWTRRSALDQPFDAPTQLTLEPEGDEGAPAFSDDLRYVMFSSTRSGVADIYERRLEAPP